MSLPSRADIYHIGTSHSYFLSPAENPEDPPVAHLLRGVNWSSAAKFPCFPPRHHTEPRTRKDRDDLRTYKTGVYTGVGEEEGRFWSEAEEGGRDGWFVGRPIEEEAAELHLRRLKAWGFTTIRYLIPWEALEHAGPGRYDEQYIDYTIRLLRKCQAQGFRVFISPHQDVFSRFLSGSGAPYWLLEAFGLNPRNVHQTGAALVHACWGNEGYGGTEGIQAATDGGEWPDMIWNTNLHRLAARHCFTLFFASEVFAPKCKIDGVPVGQWARDHYDAAYGHLVDRLRDAGGLLDDCVIGWDSMNEPDQGFIGMEGLNDFPESQDFRKGPSPTPIQGFRLGVGQSVSDIAYDDFGSLGHKKKGKVTISPVDGKGVWLTRDEARAAAKRWGWQWGEEWSFWDEDGRGGCPWAGHDVWRPSDGTVLQDGYFNPGHQGSDFINNFWKRQHAGYVTRIRKAHSNGIAFINPPIFANPPDLSEHVKHGRMALSAHFYDGLTMLGKRRHRFNADAVGVQRNTKGLLAALKIGPSSIRNGFRQQFGELKSDSSKQDGIAADTSGKRQYPTLIGELGTPFDMKKSGLLGMARGSKKWGDYKEATKAMDDLLNGCDGENALSYTLWVYEPLNSHSRGDGWNGEDLSLFSYDDCQGDDDLVADDPPDLKTLITLGSRGIESWCRPYPVEMTGQLEMFSFDMKTARFELRLEVPALDGSRLWQGEREKQDVAEGETWGDGFVKIYLPFVHYLRTAQHEEVQVTRAANRVVGIAGPDHAEWERGKGAAVVDLEVEEISEGKLVAEGAESAQGQFGMVTINSDNSVTTSTDFDNLKTQLGQISPPNSPSSGSSSSSFPSCPAENSTFLASTSLPPTPVDSACSCLATSVSCEFTPTQDPDAVVGDLLNQACGLLGQQGGSCDDIAANGTTGSYGSVSACDASTKLAYVFSLYYEKTNKAATSCDFSGNATISRSNSLSAPSAASSCLASASGTSVPVLASSASGTATGAGSGSSSTASSGSGNSSGAVATADMGAGLRGLVAVVGLAVMSGWWVLA